MINTMARIDYLATAGRSPWHRASAVAKLSLAAGMVGLAVFAPGWAVLAMLLLTALALALSAQIPAGLIAAAASTPVLFAFIFALARWQGEWLDTLVLFARPIIAGITALWLVGTTPYPDLFAPLSRILPRAVGDSLFLTYRAAFALLAQVERVWMALRLRGGLGGPLDRRANTMGEAVGTVVLSGFERSHRLYQAMLLRGHSGRICGCRHWLDRDSGDAWVVATAAWIVVASAGLWGWGAP